MRIIAGEAKGRRINAPVGRETRPTSDRVKESIFNILGDRVPGAKILDLFAGTGNMGLEAISRGAEHCIFIDSSKEAIRIIHENINTLKYQDKCEVYNNDAIAAMEILNKRNIKFDIIFLDPPYHKNIITTVLKTLNNTEILNHNGLIIAEHDNKDIVPDVFNEFIMIKKAEYGNTTVSFYRKKGE